MKKLLLLFCLVFTMMNCQRDECANGIKDGDEVDIDCGGRCGECPNCLDGIQNYQELGVDCGSNCKPCKNTWELLPGNTQTNESSWLMEFSDENHGLIVGKIFHQAFTTKDGGKTWDPAFLVPYLGSSQNPLMTKLYMADDSLGFLMEQSEPAWGAESYLYRTTDGGTTWQLVDNPTEKDVAYYEDIEMVDNELGFLSLTVYDNGQYGESRIYRTRDGGKSWSLRSTSVPFQFLDPVSFSLPFKEIESFGKDLIRVYTKYGIIESRDEGTSWTLFTQNNMNPIKVKMLDENVGFAQKSFYTDFDNRLYKTINGGKDWLPITKFEDERFAQNYIWDFHFVTPDKGFVFPDNVIQTPGYVTKDGGENYESLGIIDLNYYRTLTNSELIIYEIDYIGDGVIYGIGDKGILFKLKYEE